MFRDWLSIIITTAVAKNRDFRGQLKEETRERSVSLNFENHPQTLGSKPLVRSGNWKASELAKPRLFWNPRQYRSDFLDGRAKELI